MGTMCDWKHEDQAECEWGITCSLWSSRAALRLLSCVLCAAGLPVSLSQGGESMAQPPLPSAHGPVSAETAPGLGCGSES